MTTTVRNRAKPERPGKEQLIGMLRQMMLIRRFEEKAAEMYARRRIGGFLHLYIGQEAIAVGAINAINDDDYIVSHYREHGHALARGLDPNRLMAELFGKDTGVSRGRGGSMHLFDVSRSFLGGYAIVGGGMPLAVGLALAASRLGSRHIAVNIFGDGAVNQGEFHESLNLATVWKLPVLFLCENNFYAMGTDIRHVSAVAEPHKRACAYNIPAEAVDGQDVMAVYEATLRAANWAREGKGPYFLEAITYRQRGHSMADAELYRDKSEVEEHKKRDPILLFQQRLETQGLLPKKELESLEARVEAEINEAARFAEESPEPDLSALYEHVYKE